MKEDRIDFDWQWNRQYAGIQSKTIFVLKGTNASFLLFYKYRLQMQQITHLKLSSLLKFECCSRLEHTKILPRSRHAQKLSKKDLHSYSNPKICLFTTQTSTLRLTVMPVPARLVSHATAAARALYFGPQLAACRLCLPRACRARPSVYPSHARGHTSRQSLLDLYVDSLRNTYASLRYSVNSTEVVTSLSLRTHTHIGLHTRDLATTDQSSCVYWLLPFTTLGQTEYWAADKKRCSLDNVLNHFVSPLHASMLYGLVGVLAGLLAGHNFSYLFAVLEEKVCSYKPVSVFVSSFWRTILALSCCFPCITVRKVLFISALWPWFCVLCKHSNLLTYLLTYYPCSRRFLGPWTLPWTDHCPKD